LSAAGDEIEFAGRSLQDEDAPKGSRGIAGSTEAPKNKLDPQSGGIPEQGGRICRSIRYIPLYSGGEARVCTARRRAPIKDYGRIDIL